MAKNSDKPWWFILMAFLGPMLSAFLTGILNLVPSGRPRVALVLVIVEFIFLCLVIGLLAYLASPRKTKDRILGILKMQGVLVAVSGAAGLVIGAIVVTYLWSQRVVLTPDVVGKNLAQATIELRNTGLRQDVLHAPGSDDFSSITHQEPDPNVEVMKGSIVKLVRGVLEVSVQITDPPDQGSIAHTAAVRGTSKGIAESRGRLRANLLLHSFNADGYWVYGPLAVDNDGNWEHTVYVGQPSEVGRKFQLLAVVTREALNRQGSGGGPPEYQEFPPHIAISKQVVVTRK